MKKYSIIWIPELFPILYYGRDELECFLSETAKLNIIAIKQILI